MERQIRDKVQSAKLAFIRAENNPELVAQSVKDCSKDLRVLRKALQRAKNIGEKNGIISAITLILSYRTQLKHIKLRAASNPNSNRANWASSRVNWEDVQSAFSNR